MDPERSRLREAQCGEQPWYRWGPYLSERQWGTVREDYSADGDAWNAFTHDMARRRAYRWGEDGLLGISDESGLLCFALSLWNGADPFLKERLFGVSNPEGNHGEDVKECYYYLDNTPSHSYMKALYVYPQRRFPYEDLVAQSASRSREEGEFELPDTGIFDENRYFDVTVEYAKAGPEDLVIRIAACNRGPDEAEMHLLPTLWFRNTWSWGRDDRRPAMEAIRLPDGVEAIRARHHELGDYWLVPSAAPELLFTENDTNAGGDGYFKDGIGRAVVDGEAGAVNPARRGTKAAVHYTVRLAPGEERTITLRLAAGDLPRSLEGSAETVAVRREEADAFYAPLEQTLLSEERGVLRGALAGLLWSKQYYNYDVRVWLEGDPASPPPADERRHGRNHDWTTLNNNEVLSMPDSWEYPWYASWDLAFQCVPLALVDPAFAKKQLTLLMREWYMRPDGQIPAYEWNLSQVNPPVQAWAARKVYEIERDTTGTGDRTFLKRIFHKLLINFTWWVNRKDPDGNNVFEGGFLGLDNICVFDRDAPLPGGGRLRQADATAWMGSFCVNMLAIALELAAGDDAYEDIATKFFEHFMLIAGALNNRGDCDIPLWDDEDQFFYDVVRFPDGTCVPLRVRSIVGLMPLCAVLTINPQQLERLPNFTQRLEWFLENRPDLAELVPRWNVPGEGRRHLLALVHGDVLRRLLDRMLDPDEFLSDGGIRSLSRFHREHPYELHVDGVTHTVSYEPGESSTGMFGGNSNWRGPVWFPINYLLIDALRAFHCYYGDDVLVPHAGADRPLDAVAGDLGRRLVSLLLPSADGSVPSQRASAGDPHPELLLFHEYFHADTGAGLGASHQTGWTALVANLLVEGVRRDAVRGLEHVDGDLYVERLPVEDMVQPAS